MRLKTWLWCLMLAGALALVALPASADDQGEEGAGATMEIYGFAMLDMGYQGGQNHPDWFDVLRPTKLPSFENEFGEDGHWFSGVRQSRLGVKANFPTSMGEVKTTFEFELFGTGVDAGQTTFRLRHAYGELGHFGAGQTWSPFMDIDGFPNSVEYWGPNGMAFFRNVQVRWMPIQGDTRMTIALERPGASGDGGEFADRIEIQNLRGRFPYPDLSGEYRHATPWGYIEGAGIVRYMKWDDTLDDQFDLSGSDIGWGINLSSNIKAGKSVFRLQALYGEGIENYMNDAPVDVGARLNPGDARTPIEGEALGVLGLVAFVDVNWSDKASSAIGWSMIDIDNSDGQADNAFSQGNYALANIMFYPAKNVMFGPEIQWGNRKNFRDGFTSDDLRFQFSAKYNFSHKIGG
ncbi:MAG TPA: DcaP family trimeric outer membrane transporter [Thermoanaerobaculia bacterium]|nr:DcaP family trimeric outer membrane transporter [Thermoanaerobaculia bacterium]